MNTAHAQALRDIKADLTRLVPLSTQHYQIAVLHATTQLDATRRELLAVFDNSETVSVAGWKVTFNRGRDRLEFQREQRISALNR